MAKRVTKRQAEKVLTQVRRQFKPYLEDGNGPVLKMDFDWFGYGDGPAIVWEGGPYEWAILSSLGGVDEEMAELQQEVGEYLAGKKPMRAPIVEPLKVEGVFVEPITSWALGLYPEQ